MILLILAYLGGVLTIVSPCILPVLPFVFSRAERPFLRSGLPMLIGMAATFTFVATLAAVGGSWAVRLNQYGRYAALVVLAVLGLSLLSRRVADWISHPFVKLGNRLSQTGNGDDDSVWSAAGLGVATGLLWAPCAGPILGLLLTGAALNGANASTTILLLVYAAGAVTSLGLALLVGGHVFSLMKRSLGVGEWLRRGLGVLVLVGVAAIAMGLDTGVLTRVSLASTGVIEQRLLDAAKQNAMSSAYQSGQALPVGEAMPPLTGATQWMNSQPLTTESLRGKVVLVDFWTYSCINCLRALPYVRAWSDKYKDHGLVVIGVHAPEFAFEKDPDNVADAIKELGVQYPVALDNDFAIWKAFKNQYWPAHYFIDAKGRIRHLHFGEGEYDKSEEIIRQLLIEAGQKNLPDGMVNPTAQGVQAEGSGTTERSPETYVGYWRADNFVGGTIARDIAHDYEGSETFAPNQWTISGRWQVGQESAELLKANGRILFRFRGRDLHLVLGPGKDGKPVRFRVRLDGQAPASDHGVDIDTDGNGTVMEHRLYQLIRQSKGSEEKTFEIEFLDPGVRAYAFTFG